MFEKASRVKLRFKVSNGVVSVEDLWAYSLETLNMVAKDLNKQVKESEEDDFLEEHSTIDTLLNLRFDIVKHIIKVKQEDKKVSLANQAKEQRKAKLREIIEAKQDDELSSMSLKKLLKELEDLG